MNDKAPSGRELSPKVTEGECDCTSNKARVFTRRLLPSFATQNPPPSRREA